MRVKGAVKEGGGKGTEKKTREGGEADYCIFTPREKCEIPLDS